VIDDQLTVRTEKFLEGNVAVRSAESVRLDDLDTRQFPSRRRDAVALPD